MATTSSTTEPTKPAPRRRPLFNRPTWSKPQVSSNAADFFSRSDQTYVSVVADEERRRKKRLPKKVPERGVDSDGRDNAGKRRRISVDSDDDDNDSDSREDSDDNAGAMSEKGVSIVQVGAEETSHSRLASPPKPVVSPKSLTERYESAIAAACLRSEQALQSNIIDLEDSEDTDVGYGQNRGAEVATVKTQKPTVYDDFEMSDEEFPELARQAREKARRKRLQADFPTDSIPGPPVPQAKSRQSDNFLLVRTPTPPLETPEPVVSILITSRIVNTKPLIVNRKLHQRLKDVRLAWCQRQGFTADITPTILLVWRGRRLFDVNSCKSLGIGVDTYGNIVTKGGNDFLGEENRQVHIEAMTEEIFEQQKKGREISQRIAREETDVQEAVVQKTPQEPQVKIILKAKGFEDFKLIVKHVCILVYPLLAKLFNKLILISQP